MQKLPIGIQTFNKLRNENYIYIDKTKEICELLNNYEYVFLSRPRRFGKSLFIDTLQELFEGNKELFKGLYIYDKYDFSPYPVIKIDWAGNFTTYESTKKTAIKILEENQERLGIECKLDDEADICFRRLIQETYKKYKKRVVILIDEYDKPILDNINNIQRANENRNFLKSLYIQLKANDKYIKFAFLTGITKFSKASIFSGLNNLVDISLNPKFGNICGYTEENLKNEFYDYSKNFDLSKIKNWYNGYYFLKDKIYNPFDILKLFDSKIFRNYWFESGNPYFLIELLKQKRYFLPKLSNIIIDETILNSFDIEKLDIEVLLYQTGYLTINKVIEKRERIFYQLSLPNLEVATALSNLTLEYLTHQDALKYELQDRLYDALEKANLQELKQTLIALFASIPYNNYINNNIGIYEGYYASVIYAYLASLGIKIIGEDVTNKGRIDLTLFIKDKIYLFEFKVEQNNALIQIKKQNYYQKYMHLNKAIYVVGITFDANEKNIKEFKWEKIK